MTNLLKMVTVTFSILFAVVLTASTATAEEIRIGDLTISQLTTLEEIKPTLDYFAEELEVARTAHVGRTNTGAVTYNYRGATVIGEPIAVAYLGNGVVNVRAAKSTFHQFLNRVGPDEQITVSKTDLIIQLKDVGSQYIVTGFWGAAENF